MCSWERRSQLHGRGHGARQCSPSYVQLPESPLRAWAFPGEWKVRSPTPPQIAELLFKIHQAPKGCLGSGGMQWGRARKLAQGRSEQQHRHCGPQPCSSGKTIAELMHTPDDVRDTAQTDCAAWTRGSRVSREQRDSKGNSFVTECTRPKTTSTFLLLKSSSSCDATRKETSEKFKYWPSTN